MKVRELIQHLQQHDPELDVELYYHDEGMREVESVTEECIWNPNKPTVFINAKYM